MDGAEAFKESKLTAGVKKGGNGMQKEMQDIVGIGGSSIVGDDVEWKGAGVKGVRVKKVEEEGAVIDRMWHCLLEHWRLSFELVGGH